MKTKISILRNYALLDMDKTQFKEHIKKYFCGILRECEIDESTIYRISTSRSFSSLDAIVIIINETRKEKLLKIKEKLEYCERMLTLMHGKKPIEELSLFQGDVWKSNTNIPLQTFKNLNFISIRYV